MVEWDAERKRIPFHQMDFTLVTAGSEIRGVPTRRELCAEVASQPHLHS